MKTESRRLHRGPSSAPDMPLLLARGFSSPQDGSTPAAIGLGPGAPSGHRLKHHALTKSGPTRYFPHYYVASGANHGAGPAKTLLAGGTAPAPTSYYGGAPYCEDRIGGSAAVWHCAPFRSGYPQIQLSGGTNGRCGGCKPELALFRSGATLKRKSSTGISLVFVFQGR